MKIGIIISTNDAETIFNAFRLANYCVVHKEKVKIFLIGKGVESEEISNYDKGKFNLKYEMERFIKEGGEILSCGSCFIIRGSSGTELCPLSTMNDLYKIIKESDKIITF